jgi:hypothetical protein
MALCSLLRGINDSAEYGAFIWTWISTLKSRTTGSCNYTSAFKLQAAVSSRLFSLKMKKIYSPKIMENGVFWDVTLCGSCKNRRFGGTQRLHHQGDKNRWTRNNVRTLFLVHQFLSPWWWRRYVPPKRRFLKELNGITSQKTPLFIVTTVKTPKSYTKNNVIMLYPTSITLRTIMLT